MARPREKEGGVGKGGKEDYIVEQEWGRKVLLSSFQEGEVKRMAFHWFLAVRVSQIIVGGGGGSGGKEDVPFLYQKEKHAYLALLLSAKG